VIAGLRGEETIAEPFRKEGINQIFIISGPKSFWRRGRSDSPGNTAQEATSDRVKGIRGKLSS
jgi:hypothetical protein